MPRIPMITTSAARLFVNSSPPSGSRDLYHPVTESAGRSVKSVRFSTRVAVLPPPPLSPRELPQHFLPDPPSIHCIHLDLDFPSQGARPRDSAYRHLPLRSLTLLVRLVHCPNYLRTISRPTLRIRQSSRNQAEKRLGLGVADIICEQRWSGTRIVSQHFRFVHCLLLISKANRGIC